MTEKFDTNPPPELSEQDAELLSAYIDNALTDAAAARLEARLTDDAALRQEYQAMQRTVAWLGQMPPLKAPRDFTITDADAQRSGPAKIVPLRPSRQIWLSAAAAVVVVVFGVIVVLSLLGPTVGNIFSNTINGLRADGGVDGASQVAARATQAADTDALPAMTATPMPTSTVTAAPSQPPAIAVTGTPAAMALPPTPAPQALIAEETAAESADDFTQQTEPEAPAPADRTQAEELDQAFTTTNEVALAATATVEMRSTRDETAPETDTAQAAEVPAAHPTATALADTLMAAASPTPDGADSDDEGQAGGAPPVFGPQLPLPDGADAEINVARRALQAIIEALSRLAGAAP